MPIEEAETVIVSVTNRGPVISPELVERCSSRFNRMARGAAAGTSARPLHRARIVRPWRTIEVRSADEVSTFAVTLRGPLYLHDRLLNGHSFVIPYFLSLS
jgi:hypothetical protein